MVNAWVDALERQTAADAQTSLQIARLVNKELPLTVHEPRLAGWDPLVEIGQPAGLFSFSLSGFRFLVSGSSLPRPAWRRRSAGRRNSGTLTAATTYQAAVIALLYIDVRMRREALDVELARAATADSPA